MAELTWAQGWFGDKDDEPAAATASFTYAPDLIAGLQAEHRGLLRRLAEIEKLVIGKNYDAIPHSLAAFKSKFNVHVLRENLHCYGYLEQGLADHPAELASVRTFRGEIDAIARSVLDFIEKHRSAGVREANAQEFLTGLRAVGAALVERIQREEKDLYSLYTP